MCECCAASSPDLLHPLETAQVLGTSIGSMPNVSFWVLSGAPEKYVLVDNGRSTCVAAGDESRRSTGCAGGL